MDQSQIVDFAFEGHNVLITGQAGVGKSEVVKAFDLLERRNVRERRSV